MTKISCLLLVAFMAFSSLMIAQPPVDEAPQVIQKPKPKPKPKPKSKYKLTMDESDVYTVVEEMPRFAGCEGLEGTNKEKQACAEKKMLEFIYSNIEYPNLARENGREGTVVIRFVIDEKGNVIKPQILREIGDGCGKEGLRVVKKMNSLSEKWTPGKQRGKAVKVQFNLPIRFKLDNKKKKSAPKPVVNVKTWTDLFCENFSSGFIDEESLQSMLEEGKPNISCDNKTKPHHFHVVLMGKGEASEVKKNKWGKRMNKMLVNAKKGNTIVIHYDEGGKLITKNLTVK